MCAGEGTRRKWKRSLDRLSLILFLGINIDLLLPPEKFFSTISQNSKIKVLGLLQIYLSENTKHLC